MTLRARVVVAATVGLVVLTALIALVALRFASAVDAGRAVFIDAVPVSTSADALVLSRVEAEGDLQDYILTGDPSFRAALEQTVARGDSSLAALMIEGADDPELATLVTAASAARDLWWTVDASPSIDAVAAGDRAAAARITQSDAAWTAYLGSVASARAIRTLVDTRRAAAFEQLARIARQLGFALVAAGVVVAAATVLLLLGLRAWVLIPIDQLRRQLREVARRGEHHQPIAAHGPPELLAAGRDAELLRRHLVAEIDEARMAREGLAQDAPVVAAVRRELGVGVIPQVDGLAVAGILSPAEGVLAGDWWDVRILPSGELALSLCDVSGHGPEAGICALRVRHSVITTVEGGGSPADALSAAARGFAQESERFATVVVIIVDPTTGVVRWANAGHHPPLVLGGDEGQLEGTGPLLSWLGGQWHDRTLNLALDQAILAFTDGLLESHDAGGEELEEHGIRAMAGSWPPDNQSDSISDLVERITAAARQRASDWQRDDVTVVALART